MDTFLVYEMFCVITGDFSIPVGVFGQMMSGGRKSVSDMEVPIIQWEIMYDGWQLLKCEVQELLYQISRGAGDYSKTCLKPLKNRQNKGFNGKR